MFPALVKFKYERLSNLYFNCCKLSHVIIRFSVKAFPSYGVMDPRIALNSSCKLLVTYRCLEDGSSLNCRLMVINRCTPRLLIDNFKHKVDLEVESQDLDCLLIVPNLLLNLIWLDLECICSTFLTLKSNVSLSPT